MSGRGDENVAVAVVFPGQGAQHVGMGVELAAAYPEAREVWDRAGAVLGFDLLGLAANGPEAELTRTANAQPALLAASLATVAVLRRHWWEPVVGAGLSLGEYSALVAGGALTLEDGLRLVRLRGLLMEEAVAPGVGTMAAILGLDADTVAALCREAAAGEVVGPANYNGPGQIVISGHAGAVARAMDLALAAGARRAMPLTVSGPFHSSLMQPARDQLARELAQVPIEMGSLAVVGNAAAAIADSPEAIRTALADQVTAPVRWEQSVRLMAAMGVEVFLELGPGKTLSGLISRILRGARILAVNDPRGLTEALAKLKGAC